MNTQAITRLLAIFCLAFLLSGSATAQDAAAAKTASQVVPLVNNYCGACHAVPQPDVLPKKSWPAVVRTMVEIMQQRRGRAFLTEEQMRDITAFYYSLAPESLPRLPPLEDARGTREFVAREAAAGSPLPFVTHVSTARLGGSEELEFIVCDGEAKQLLLLRRHRGGWREIPLAKVEVPVHAQTVDFDADGDGDVLVADLGQFPPVETQAGKLYLLRQVAPGRFAAELLLDKLGRVSDARAVDLDADGDLDIAVAVFGGGDQGELFWLERAGEELQGGYRKHLLLAISGAITALPADLNADGRMDLVTLVAQEHEAVVAFMGTGKGEFEQRQIARAPHPMYGSTSLDTVDLDRDGDLDILFTNGDAFDAQTDPKPYHGVQWLENRGNLEFRFHDIGRFYGAATAAAGDLDGDGDLDVVAGSWISYWNEPGRYALVWYENDGKQLFTPHGIATRPPGVVSLQLSDVNGDGAPDIVAGALRMDLLLARLGVSYRAGALFPSAVDPARLSRVVVFENRRARARKR